MRRYSSTTQVFEAIEKASRKKQVCFLLLFFSFSFFVTVFPVLTQTPLSIAKLIQFGEVILFVLFLFFCFSSLDEGWS
jgi:low temperature requirement protein LtrA